MSEIPDDTLNEQIISTFYDQVDSDDESYIKKGRQLSYIYNQHPEIVDYVLIALCGWSYESLKNMAERELIEMD